VLALSGQHKRQAEEIFLLWNLFFSVSLRGSNGGEKGAITDDVFPGYLNLTCDLLCFSFLLCFLLFFLN